MKASESYDPALLPRCAGSNQPPKPGTGEQLVCGAAFGFCDSCQDYIRINKDGTLRRHVAELTRWHAKA